ncbi:MAG: peptidoglycan-binding protein [Deltaproteobacteria bacterium]|nr:peptidoglycan-binding protein [Deltaproteobacteria bacterium]
MAVPTTGHAKSWLDQQAEKFEKEWRKATNESSNKSGTPIQETQGQQKKQASQPAADKSKSFQKGQVREAQRILTELGYNPGPVDGAYGATTAEAIRAYQADYGLPQTGEPTDKLLVHMTLTLGARKNAAIGRPTTKTSQPGSGAIIPVSPEISATVAKGDPLNYANLLKLYIAEHGDLLENKGFAWHYFQLFKAPDQKSPACLALRREIRNPIKFEGLVNREKAEFSRELKRYENAPTKGIFTVPAIVRVDNYDHRRETFTVAGLSISPKNDLRPEPKCKLKEEIPGPGYVPRFDYNSIIIPSTAELPDEIHLSREVFSEYRAKTRRDLKILKAVATVRVDPLPFVGENGQVKTPGKVVGLAVEHPFSGRVLSTYTFEDVTSEEKSVAEVPSNSIMELTDYSLPLYIIRDNPDIVPQDVMHELTKGQVSAEQDYWQQVDANIIRNLKGLEKGHAMAANINMAEPVLAYEWQSLIQSDPDLARQVLELFNRPDASWDFYYKEPTYDPRLTSFVAASIFSRKAMGLPDIRTLKPEKSRTGQKAYSNLPLPDYLLSELAPVMGDFLRQSGEFMPNRVRLDFVLNARFDASKGLLMLGDESAPKDAEPVKPLKMRERVRFAADNTEVESALYLPLPMSAKNRFIYSPQLKSTQVQPGPGIASGHRSAVNSWQRMLSAYGGKISRVAGLALDREVAFSAFQMPREKVERIKGERYSRSPSFPVTGRLVLDVERMDMVRVYGPKSSARQKQQMNNSVLLARVTGLELLDQDGGLIHRYDVSGLTSADKVAADEKAASDKVRAVEEAAREKNEQELSAGKEALSKADVIGIRPGMTVEEAEKIIRSHMEVGWVGELAEDSTIAQLKSPDRPYHHFRTYISKNGREHIAIFWHPEISERLQAVTRTLMLPDNISDETVFAQLKEKYGSDVLIPSNKVPAWIWTVDYGAAPSLRKVSGVTNEMRFRRGTCYSTISPNLSMQYLNILDGEPLTRQVKKRLPNAVKTTQIRVLGGGSGQLKQKQWDPDAWQECGPTVSAEIKTYNKDKVLAVGMYDLSTYAPVYDALMKKKKKDGQGKGKRLSL